MSEPKDQMSLLDAIGLDEPLKTQQRQPGGIAAKQKKLPKKAPASEKALAETLPDPESVHSAAKKTATSDTSLETGEKQARGAVPASMPEPAETPPLDKHICFALYSANHAMHGVYKTLLKETGLTYPQFLAMSVLWDTNNVPVGAITSKLQLDTNTLTPLLKRLEGMGLVTRTRNRKDERQVLLKLTRKGHALKKKTAHFGGCIFSASGLQMSELEDLQAKIMDLRDNLRASGAE